MKKRHFLFLQGPSTPFFSRLATQLRAHGHLVWKIQFNAGDTVYWFGGGSLWFRSTTESLPSFLDDIYHKYGITDQILFGDQRPVHRPAIAYGDASGVRTHVFEEGYFRPWWITLEREGVNAHSLLPRDPDWFREVSERVGEPQGVREFSTAFFPRALHDVAYHLVGVMNPILFPNYRTHAPVPAPIEYAGYVKRFTWLRLFGKREKKRVAAFIASARPYFVLPLQLNSDAQIRDHSRFTHMGEVIDYVAKSFASHAPRDYHLVIKNHPLDTGLMSYRRILDEVTRRYDLEGRIHFFEEGDLVALLKHSRGVVTVNSTAGIVALEQGVPVLTLSDPIYNLSGLTAQMSLEEFWRNPPPPAPALFQAFRRVVIHAAQINGGFYTTDGIALAVKNAAHVLTAEYSPLEQLL